MNMFDNREGSCLIIEGGSPKGKYQFLLENREARDLYNQILGVITTFIELNQECVHESFDELERAHNKPNGAGNGLPEGPNIDIPIK